MPPDSSATIQVADRIPLVDIEQAQMTIDADRKKKVGNLAFGQRLSYFEAGWIQRSARRWDFGLERLCGVSSSASLGELEYTDSSAEVGLSVHWDCEDLLYARDVGHVHAGGIERLAGSEA